VHKKGVLLNYIKKDNLEVTKCSAQSNKISVKMVLNKSIKCSIRNPRINQ